MNYGELTEQEIDKLVDKAQTFCREKIRPRVYPQQKNRMLVIDFESLDYEIAEREPVATRRLRERRPGSVPLVIRIGYKATCRIPGRWTPEDEC